METGRPTARNLDFQSEPPISVSVLLRFCVRFCPACATLSTTSKSREYSKWKVAEMDPRSITKCRQCKSPRCRGSYATGGRRRFRRLGMGAVLKAQMAALFCDGDVADTTPTVADVTSELARCELEAERLYAAHHNKGVQNWPERPANLRNGPRIWERLCEGPVIGSPHNVPRLLRTYESCMNNACTSSIRGPTGSRCRNTDWNGFPLDNEWDMQNPERLWPDCYQSISGWRR